MANVQNFSGFSQLFGGSGGAPTFNQVVRKVASTNTVAIFYGDPVVPVTSTANGYITQAPNTDSTVLAGIFVGCTYISVAQKRRVWGNYWPGSDANGDVTAYIVDDPNAQFLVSTSPPASFNISGTVSAFGYSPVGQYAQFNIGAGNTATGRSGAYLCSIGTTVTYPFIITDMWESVSNGGDPTSTFCNVVVGFNNELRRTNGAGPTGIS